MEQIITSKMVDGVEVVLSSVTNSHKWHAGRSYLVETTQEIGNGQSLTTQYDYDWADTYPGVDGCKLKHRINPDGSWEKYEYDPQTGRLLRTLRPWLSGAVHPGNATLAECQATTFYELGAHEQWTQESMLGIVTSRTRTRSYRELMDPLLLHSSPSAMRIPVWEVGPINAWTVNGGFIDLESLEDATISIANPFGHYPPRLRASASDFNGSIADVLEHLSGARVTHDSSTGKWRARSPYKFDFRIEDPQLVPGWPASVLIVCHDADEYETFDPVSGLPTGTGTPHLTVLLNGVALMSSSFSATGSGAYKASSLAAALQPYATIDPDQPNMVYIEAPEIGDDYVFEMDGTFGDTYSVYVIQGAYDSNNYGILVTGVWQEVPGEFNPLENQMPANLDAFNGIFDITKTQRFTQDYSAWTGHMELRNAGTAGSQHGELRRTVDSAGRVTLYSHQHGLFDPETSQFDWSEEGHAIKTTTRTYAANPATFELLAEDPVYQVTMSDYQGLARVEQTWHGEDLVKEVLHDYDPATRERLSSTENGVVIFSATRDTEANNYTTVDASGTVTVQNFAENGAYLDTRKLGHAGRPDVVSSSEEGDFTSHSSTSAGGLTRRSSTTRDLAGRTVSSTDENGLTTTYAYELGGRRVIETRPDGGTRITENHLDGRLKTVTGTAVVPEFHDYEVDSGGNLIHTVYFNDDGTGGQRSPRWRRTVTNGIGWLIREESPAPGGQGVLATVHHYNEKGQLVRTERGGQKNELTTYDLFGRVASRGLDLNGNGTLDHDFSEPVTSTESETVKMNGQWWERLTTIELASAQGIPMRSKVSRRLLSGALYEAAVEQTSDGLVTARVTTRDPASKTVTTTQTSNRSAHSAVQIMVNGLLVSQTGLDSTGTVLYGYDPLERLTTVTDASGITRRTVFDDLPDGTARSFVLREELRPAGAADFQAERTHAYHPQGAPGAGRLAQTTQADGSTLTHAYDLHGRRTFTGGTGTYPVRHEYDAFGDLWKMHTWRSGSPSAEGGGDVTTWTRDPATGLLLGKTDALSQGATYTYDPASGRLLTRAWARQSGGAPVTATYAYDDAGRLATITYNDGTPGVTHTYHPDGRPATTSDAAGLRTYHYEGPNGELSGESITGGLLDGAALAYSHHPETHRRTGLSWSWGGQSRTLTHTHDSAGRLHTVTAFGKTATYTHDPATGRRQSLAYSGGKLTGAWTHDSHGRLESISWHNGLANVSQHQYTFDAMNRRATVLREDAEQWRYAYNPRGEVTSGVKARTPAQEAALRTGLQFGYGYDLIGNRVSESVDAPGGAQSLAWSANAANQITQRETPDARWVLGRAHPEAALAVTGGGAAVREGAEFAVPVTMSDGEQSEWRAVSITASRQGVGRNGGDVSQTREGKLWLPASPESFTHDADGNLTSDGRWSYEWDAENRLKAMQTLPAAATAGVPAQRLEFAYDAQSRRIRKRVQEWNDASGSFTPISDHRFLYDGWNLIAEFKTGLNQPSTINLQRAYAWGLDLSGTEQGAGGVGGLLLVEQPSTALAPCYDGNGNITAYVHLESGAVQASFDYDPFGKPVWTDLTGTGDLPPFRFSTKYEDAETGLVYYGYRYYSPEFGRWMARDPIEEAGGLNTFAFLLNSAINLIDILGQQPSKPSSSTAEENWKERDELRTNTSIDLAHPKLRGYIQDAICDSHWTTPDSHEEGGWVYGNYSLKRWPRSPDSNTAITPNARPGNTFLEFHTHPDASGPTTSVFMNSRALTNGLRVSPWFERHTWFNLGADIASSMPEDYIVVISTEKMYFMWM